MPLKGHAYHNLSDESLRFIIKDAGEAAEAMRHHNDNAEAKYLDQINDASTVLHFRAQQLKRLNDYKNSALNLKLPFGNMRGENVTLS